MSDEIEGLKTFKPSMPRPAQPEVRKPLEPGAINPVEKTPEEKKTFRKHQEDAPRHLSAEQLKASNRPADMLFTLLEEALERGASDIHVEPQARDVAIRLRVDGRLQEWHHLAKKPMEAVINRIKFLSGLDFSITDKISEGRFSHTWQGQPVHFRVSVIPTPNGQDMVLRILRTGPQFTNLTEAGLPPQLVEDIRRELQRSSGLIVVAGATGSGKTTTLFAAIQEIKDGDRKIITVEDPIEYKLDGITQLRLHQKLGLSYAALLKTTLRHDPDIILIGETRDLEAAQIAVQASMTGHLVLTTLHTSSAVGAIVRLLNLGIRPVDLANSLTAVYSQHLLRRLCPACARQVPVSEKFLRYLPKGITPPAHMYEPVGCEKCHDYGFKGRLPLAELILIDDEMREVILTNPKIHELKEAIRRHGFKTFMEHGISMAEQGLITLEDVLKVA